MRNTVRHHLSSPIYDTLQDFGIDMKVCRVEMRWKCHAGLRSKRSTVQVGKSAEFEIMMISWCFLGSLHLPGPILSPRPEVNTTISMPTVKHAKTTRIRCTFMDHQRKLFALTVVKIYKGGKSYLKTAHFDTLH